mmetsp:Transcript_36215/g.115996  ORF Transcript_36215/g.115996 Transcript_36215/m.115996 type:complete len:216 (-) Transcript_36215:240-887(-)
MLVVSRRIVSTMMLSMRWFGSEPDVSEPLSSSSSSLAEDIASNPTIFGRLLRREAPVRVLYEDDEFLSFRNIKPYAPLAGLVIPKRFVLQDPDGLGVDDLATVERMREVAIVVAKQQQPEAFAAGDVRLCFHRPPFSSVAHLHLHVLAPASAFPAWTTLVFFAPTPWAIDVDDVIAHLRRRRQQLGAGDEGDRTKTPGRPTNNRGKPRLLGSEKE